MKRSNGQKKVGDLQPAPYNPRTITEEQLDRLGRSMQEFGDLSGIVYNRRSGRIIGGHQRLKHVDPDASIQLEETFEESNEQGTVAIGHTSTTAASGGGTARSTSTSSPRR